jgi:hypothetical protein
MADARNVDGGGEVVAICEQSRAATQVCSVPGQRGRPAATIPTNCTESR